jgi:hypothetical protein
MRHQIIRAVVGILAFALLAWIGACLWIPLS